MKAQSGVTQLGSTSFLCGTMEELESIKVQLDQLKQRSIGSNSLTAKNLKRRQRTLKNRLAARRSRVKGKSAMSSMKVKVRELEEENRLLRQALLESKSEDAQDTLSREPGSSFQHDRSAVPDLCLPSIASLKRFSTSTLTRARLVLLILAASTAAVTLPPVRMRSYPHNQLFNALQTLWKPGLNGTPLARYGKGRRRSGIGTSPWKLRLGHTNRSLKELHQQQRMIY